RVTVGNILAGTVCSRQNISVIESLSVRRTEKVVAVFCLGGYCYLEGQAVVLIAMESSNSALSESSVKTTIAVTLDIYAYLILLFSDVRGLSGRYLSTRQVRNYEMIHFYPAPRIKVRSWPHAWRAVTSSA
ncbi:hypothetical protein ASPFODRAFT_92577, partial [Aspergillus luchuensis CBS 106.47]